jgi:hypothetical protein
MRRTVAVVVAAVAGLAILTGCGGQPQRLDGAATSVGAVQGTTAAAGAGPSAAGAVPAKASQSSQAGDSESAQAGDSESAQAGDSERSAGGGSALVLGPDGVGDLRLGMSLPAALGTGLLTGKSAVDPGGCDAGYRLKSTANSVIWFSADKKIIAIGAEAATPEGITVGSSRADVKRAYPKYDQVSDPEPMDGRGLAAVPGNSKAQFRIVIEDDKVTSVTLQSTEQGCYE